MHPSVHPSVKSIALTYPAWVIEYVFDTTRAAVNLIFGGALRRFDKIRFILSHAGGTLPYLASRLSLVPMLEPQLSQSSREEILTDLKSFWYYTALSSGAQTMGTLSRVAGKGRILFGGDWPFCDSRGLTEEMADLSAQGILAPKTIEMITRGNALALFPRRATQCA